MTPEGLQTFLDESPTKTLDLLHHIQSFNFSWGEFWIRSAFADFFQGDGVLFSKKNEYLVWGISIITIYLTTSSIII